MGRLLERQTWHPIGTSGLTNTFNCTLSRPEAIFLEKSYRQAARKFVADGLVVQGRPWKNLSVKFSWEAKVLWRAWRNFPETSEK